MATSLIACISNFSGQLYFQRSYFTLLQSNYFDTTVAFTKQLFLQGIYFFCYELVFQNNNFAAAVTFSEKLLFQVETSTEQPPLENKKILSVVTFRNSNLFDEEIVQNKDINTRATFSKQVPLHNIKCFRRATLWKIASLSEKQYSMLTTFSGELLFSKATLSSIAASQLFKRATFLQHTLSEELPFHSYTSFPQLHLLFISQ